MLAAILFHSPLQEVSEAAFYFAVGVFAATALRVYIAKRKNIG